MFSIPQLVLPPFMTEVPAAGVVSWPFGLQIAVWLAIAALVGIALGILRDRTSGRPLPRIQINRSVRPRRAQLRHA